MLHYCWRHSRDESLGGLRERNDRERKLIIDEITKRKPAFVIHLGDLTARGSSKKHWQQFDDFHKGFREERIPCFPVLGNHELYGADKSALETYFKRFPPSRSKAMVQLYLEECGAYPG